MSFNEADTQVEAHNAKNWLDEPWNRADAISLALENTGLGPRAQQVRGMASYLRNAIGEMLGEIEMGNLDLAEEYHRIIMASV